MSLSPANARKMQFTLRYPPDKIVSAVPYTGSFTATASSFTGLGHRTESAINHTFGSTCFLQLVYSTDGGTTWHDMGSAVPNLSTPSAPVFQTVNVGCCATTTQFVVVASNYTTSAKTVQYIMVAFWKD